MVVSVRQDQRRRDDRGSMASDPLTPCRPKLCARRARRPAAARPDDAVRIDHHGCGTMSPASAVASGPPASISDTMGATSITVTATAQRQRAERLAHAMRDHLRVVHDEQHGADGPAATARGCASPARPRAAERSRATTVWRGSERQDSGAFHAGTIAHDARHSAARRSQVRSITGRPARTVNRASVSIVVSRRVTSSTTRSDVVSCVGVSSTTP